MRDYLSGLAGEVIRALLSAFHALVEGRVATIVR